VEVRHTPPHPGHAESIANWVVTPYNADVFEHFLHKFNFDSHYPELVYNIRQGFSIGNMPILTHSYTPPNHKSVIDNPSVVCKYLAEEVSLGCMSGPFTASQVEAELGSFLISCPIGLVKKASSHGKFHIICDLSYHSKDDGYSINDHLDSDNFPTEWGTATQIADIVSLSYFLSSH
jgi:hypothetical protein